MKKTLRSLLIITTALALLVMVVAMIKFNSFDDLDGLDEPFAGEPVSYVSDSGETINAHFKTDDSVLISGHQLEASKLTISVSASGARYSNNDESLIFWLKGDEATLWKNGIISFEGSIEKPASQPLAGSIWKYTGTLSDGKQQPLTTGTSITLNFNDSRFFGEAGCNSFFGRYQFDPTVPDKISFSDIGSTRALCEKPVMAQEHRFLAALARSQAISLDGNNLSLHDGGGNSLQFKLFGASQ